MFKQFFWKVFFCVVPVLLALVVIWNAVARHRFKLGVDLVGGTILVYEIDTRKLMFEGKETQKPKEIAQNLAEKLKNRIDPNDLYNVVIRPAGGEGRVEIILPTGGQESADQYQKEWDDLQRRMEGQYHLPAKSLRIPRGQAQKLADKILQLVQQKEWEDKLFNTPESRKELMERTLDSTYRENEEPQYLHPLFDEFWRERRERDKPVAERAGTLFGLGWSGPEFVAPFVVLTKTEGPVEVGRLLKGYNPQTKSLFDTQNKSLRALMEEVKGLVDDNRKNREIDGWFKQQAWRKMIGLMLEKWPILKERKAAFDKIAPDSIDELVGRAVCKGDSVGQAFLVALEPMVAKDARKDPYGVLSGLYVDNIPLDDKGKPKDDSKFLDSNEVREFVLGTYGPSARIIEHQIRAIEDENIASGQSRDVTVEEVQRIKDLVSKVGSLEFRILANSVDDKAVIEAAKDMLGKANERGNEQLKVELEDDQNNGLPPPPPRYPNSKEPKRFTIKLRGGESVVTYAWVELGKQERQQLHLNNTAVQEGQSQAWAYLAAKRNQATQIPVTAEASDQKLLQGALFFSRECLDRNLPEEQRRDKKVEYFVLTRMPEIDPVTDKETPAIDGSYLVSAMNHPGDDGRPAVSFAFNMKGGLLFRDLTRKNIPSDEEKGTPVKRHLAIILDGLVMSAPTINSEISQHGQISGDFSNREVDQLVNILRAGALPATLKTEPVSENTMGATLGQDTIRKGLFAIGVAYVLILLFMIVYYRFAGLVASAALMGNLILAVGFMVAVQATFTLPGLAGLVLTLGMAVDANILIYERLREERDRGASILQALRNGYDRAFPTIIDTHLTTIFTAVVLYIVGNDQLKGFGVSLTVGLLISLYTSLFVTRVIFDLWAAGGWLKKLSMLRFLSRPDIDFMSIRYYLFAATGIFTILGGALFIGRLPDDLNIDFVGGTAYSGKLIETKAKSIEELRDLLSDKSQKERLTVVDASGKPKVKELDDKGQIYELWYGDGSANDKSKRTILVANRPAGDTAEDREKNFAQRAAVLPDLAVEQIFLSAYQKDEADPNKSRFFTVRTTEKEQELVQATLDRLLQYQDKDGSWKPLLDKVFMTYDAAELLKNGRETRVRFFASTPGDEIDKNTPVTASPSFVTTLLTRQLMNSFGVADRSQLPFTFDLANDDVDPSDDGRFKVATLTFTPKGAALKRDEVLKIKEALDKTANEFRVRPQPERLETFDSQLAAETRLSALKAIVLSWGVILLYLWFRFGSWTFGLAAVLCLIHDLFFTLGAIALCHYVNQMFPGILYIEDFKIDFVAVAALLTLVGYSVNDTIVVFDRIREVRGKNPDLTPQMINDSVNQTLSRTLLSSFTAWLVVIVLYIWGGPGVHLFAFVMVVGVVVGTYSSIYVASPLLLLFGEGGRAPARTPTAGPTPSVTGPDVRIQPAAS